MCTISIVAIGLIILGVAFFCWAFIALSGVGVTKTNKKYGLRLMNGEKILWVDEMHQGEFEPYTYVPYLEFFRDYELALFIQLCYAYDLNNTPEDILKYVSKVDVDKLPIKLQQYIASKN